MRPHDGGGGVCGGGVGVAVEEDDECLEGHTGTAGVWRVTADTSAGLSQSQLGHGGRQSQWCHTNTLGTLTAPATESSVTFSDIFYNNDLYCLKTEYLHTVDKIRRYVQ